MALAKNDMERKREKRRAKRAKIDKLTNWYMINLSWGVLCFILLSYVENLFGSASTVLTAPLVLKITGIVLAAFAVALFVLGKLGVIKNTKRAYNYAIFVGIVALCALWMGFYAVIRSAVIGIVPALGTLRSEWWYAWGFRYLIVAYLVVAFVVVTVKIALCSRSK